MNEPSTLTAKDFKSDQDVRWCPGCGDYSILAMVQRALPDFETAKHKYAFVSGIGCSSRFPYYMDTYGFHTIHGRAPAFATGLKTVSEDLEVWVITGDGDSMSIGGNHLIHLARRNVNVNMIIFNNRVYGLTKGQYSPTSVQGMVTKSTPMGSIDQPFNPASLILGAGATFYARSTDRDTKHLQEMIRRAHDHKGLSIIEVFQNCNVFNDGVHSDYVEKDVRDKNRVELQHGEPLIFGENRELGITMNNFKPSVVPIASVGREALLVHDESNYDLALQLSNLGVTSDTPMPIGVLHCSRRDVYNEDLNAQEREAIDKKGVGDLRALLHSGDTWDVS